MGKALLEGLVPLVRQAHNFCQHFLLEKMELDASAHMLGPAFG